MPRPPRLYVPGGCYHVVLRGNHREALFGTAGDRHVLNDIVAEVIERCGARIHAYCWMTNHLHALVQVSDRPLGNVVQRIAQRYSRYRHKRLSTGGHLFERRHMAKLVDIDAYFLALLRYIHLNPVKARIVESPLSYPWTSHRAFLGMEVTPWLTTEFGLSFFSNDLTQARAAYERFVLEPISDDEPDFDEEAHPEDSRILGTDEFISKIPVVPCASQSPLTLEQLATEVCGECHTTLELLRSSLRGRTIGAVRVELTRRALTRRIATLSEVARFLHRNPSSLTRLLERYGALRKQAQDGKDGKAGT